MMGFKCSVTDRRSGYASKTSAEYTSSSTTEVSQSLLFYSFPENKVVFEKWLQIIPQKYILKSVF